MPLIKCLLFLAFGVLNLTANLVEHSSAPVNQQISTASYGAFQDDQCPVNNKNLQVLACSRVLTESIFVEVTESEEEQEYEGFLPAINSIQKTPLPGRWHNSQLNSMLLLPLAGTTRKHIMIQVFRI